MTKLWLGVLLGAAFGAIACAVMIPMKMEDKPRALAGAFANRFLIGLFCGTAVLPLHPVGAGALIGLLVSLPDAIITRAYAPILILGTLFGAAGGWTVAAFGI